MPVPKQEAIDTYGHFYVLCNADKSGYTSRVFSEVSKYGWIGSLENGWKPRQPTKLVIKEFLGQPEYLQTHFTKRSSGGFGLLTGLDHEDWKKSFFDSVPEALAKAEEIKQQHADMYAKLRRLEGIKKIKLPFNTATPEMSVDTELMPEQIHFPDPKKYKEGATIYYHPRGAFEGELFIAKAEIFSAKLYPMETGNVHDEQRKGDWYTPFSPRYILDIGLTINTKKDADDGLLVSRSLSFDPSKPEDRWTYQPESPDDYFLISGGLNLYSSEEDAVKGARASAEKTLHNIKPYLSKAPQLA